MKTNRGSRKGVIGRGAVLSGRYRAERGLTLIEMTVIIMVLLTLATLLLLGARAWKRGADRTTCIINIQAVQKAVRGEANLSGLNDGVSVSGFEDRVVGPGAYFEQTPSCPAGGSYTLGGDLVPVLGSLYMNCSLEVTDAHVPTLVSGW